MKVKSYIKQAMAFIQGDTNEVIAQQNFRTADAAVMGQLYAQKSKLVQAERALETAKTNLDKAKYPTTVITNTDSYIQNLANALNAVTIAQDDVDTVNKAIADYTAISEEFNTEVEN